MTYMVKQNWKTLVKHKGRNYLIFSNRVTTISTAKAVWMKKFSHASQVIAITNVAMAATTQSACCRHKHSVPTAFTIGILKIFKLTGGSFFFFHFPFCKQFLVQISKTEES